MAFAVAWTIDPRFGLAAALPLGLVFQVLHVPNLREEASTDSKTGLLNMRHFNRAFTRALERVERTHEPLSVLMCDLDYLRNINNTYGHPAGDAVLVGIGEILRQHLREQDMAARFGGEEFVVLIAGDVTFAEGIAQQIRQSIEETAFTVKQVVRPISATMSIGVATYGRDGYTAEDLLHEADMAVYRAKRDGRNQVVVAGRKSRELAGEWAHEHLVSAPAVDHSRVATSSGPLRTFVNEVTRWSINADACAPAAFIPPSNDTEPSPVAVSPRGARVEGPSRSVLVLISLIFIGGLLGLIPELEWYQQPWGTLAIFAALTLVTSHLSMDTYGRGRTSIAVVAILSAAFLHESAGIAVTALTAALVLWYKNDSPLHRVMFNFGTFLISAEAAHGVFHVFIRGEIAAVSLARMIVPAVVAGLVYYVVNHLLLCMVRGLTEGRRALEIWRSDYLWLWPHYAVLGGLALVVALGYVTFGWVGLVALMAPAAMMHLAIKQYVDHTANSVTVLSQMNDRLTDSYEATLLALTRALDTRDEETEEHSQRVKLYTALMAKRLHMGGTELEDTLRGALLHDIGKIGVPDAILLKPGKLTRDEMQIMRQHPTIGFNMIVHIPFLSNAAQVVLHHHEMFDGTGYPSGLTGANIPLGARIFAIADTFDAMISDRPYRRALPIDVALKEIRRCSGTQFDPAIVDIFLSIPEEELRNVRNQYPNEITTSAAVVPELVAFDPLIFSH
ncbi:MAG: hypothetical protein NVS4B8_26500 [Herpetosiphon sp.]